MIESTWMECERWSAKKTTAPMLANSRTIAPVTARRGKSSGSGPTPTVNSPAALYANVAMKIDRTIWLGRSRRKLRSRRGENCVEDNCRATTLRPSTRAMTVTTVPVIVRRSVRASAEVPSNWRS